MPYGGSASRSGGRPAKRRKTLKTTSVAEVKFDDAAREEFLTGFHKRKVARAKAAQEEAARREKEERVRGRRELRQQRKADLEKHVAEVNALLRKANGLPDEDDGGTSEDEEWNGFDEQQQQQPAVEDIDREDEYVDEDKYTTVTIETVDISRDGFSKADDGSGSDAGEDSEAADGEAKEGGAEAKGGKRVWTKEKPARDKDRPKKKKKKFRYESKAERKVTRMKQKSKNSEQAKARRGGK